MPKAAPNTAEEHVKPRAGRWSSRSIGSRFQHNIFYFLIRIGGRPCAYALLYFVVFWYVLFYPGIRRRTQHYLSRRFPEHTGWWARFWDSYRLCLSFGKVLVDRAVVGIRGPESTAVTFPDREIFLDVVNEGRGFVLINSHVGCWQVAIAALDFLDMPFTMLMQRAADDVDRPYFEHAGRRESPYQVIDPGRGMATVLQMMAVLKRREILGVMGDRVFGSDANTVAVDFFGSPVLFPYSAYKLAGATGAACVVLYSHKTGPASYELRVAKVIRVPSRLGRPAEQYKPYVKEFVDSLEDFCQAYPWQFFNFFDMWQADADVDS